MNETKPLDRSEALAETLCEQIILGHLGPGEKLNEVELATRFNVSRGPVREALRRLAERSLVVFSPNAGARVIRHSLDDILHLLYVREHLEGAAAKLAALEMTADEKAGLRKLLKAHSDAIAANRDGAYVQYSDDLDFHYVIIKASRNPILFNILCCDLYARLRIFRHHHKNTPGRGEKALEEHRRILMAIEEGDPELAELLMRRHIAAARDILKRWGQELGQATPDQKEIPSSFLDRPERSFPPP